jgi:hypothetical protein
MTLAITIYALSLVPKGLEKTKFAVQRLVIAFIATIVLVVTVFCYVYEPKQLIQFPETYIGESFFTFVSFPVFLLRYILQTLNLQIPLVLGLPLSITLILTTWVAIVTISVRAIRKLVPAFCRSAKIPPIITTMSEKRNEKLGLFLLTTIAFIVRALPIIRSQFPTGFDTPFYVGTMQGKFTYPDPLWSIDINYMNYMITPLAYFILRIFGVVFGICRPLSISFISIIDLIPAVFHGATCLVMYSLTKTLTKNRNVALIAAFFIIFSPKELRITSDLYKNLFAIPVMLTTLQWYLKTISTHSLKHLLITLILLCTTLGLHTYPSLFLLITMIAYAPLHLLSRPCLSKRLFAIAFVSFIIIVLSSALIYTFSLTHFILHDRFVLSVFTPWPNEPKAVVHRIPALTNYGQETLSFLLAGIGLTYLLHKRNNEALLMITWLATTFIIIQPTLFKTFVWGDLDAKVPRFLLHLSLPMSVLAAIGAEESIKVISQIRLPITLSKRININFPTKIRGIFICSFISLLFLTLILIPLPSILKSGPGLSNSHYHAIIWLDNTAPLDSTVNSSEGTYRNRSTWLTHLNPPWVDAPNNYLLQPYNRGYPALYQSPYYDKIYDNQEAQVLFYFYKTTLFQ